jgi:hypothetical protein
VPGSPLLDAYPPECGKVPESSLQAFAEGLQMLLADVYVRRFVSVGQGDIEDPALEGGVIDAR